MSARPAALGVALLTVGCAGPARGRRIGPASRTSSAAAPPRRRPRPRRAHRPRRRHDRAAVAGHRRAGCAVACRLTAAGGGARLGGRRRNRARPGAAGRRRRQVPLRLRRSREPAADRRPALSAHADHRPRWQAPADWSLSAPSLLDLYLDARPNPRVRAFILGRMSYDPTLPPNGSRRCRRPTR